MSDTYIVNKYSTPVKDDIRDGVLNLVADNVTDLALAHPPKNHPQFDMYRMALLVEITGYLGAESPHSFEVVTVSSRNKIIGFALGGLPISGSTSEISIYYIATDKAFRRKGIMRMMMRDIIDRYPVVSLSCDIRLVPIYERYGFRCNGLQRSQIIMMIGNSIEETPLLDADEIMTRPSVVQERLESYQTHPTHKIERANQAMKNALKMGEEKAKRFLKEKKRIDERR